MKIEQGGKIETLRLAYWKSKFEYSSPCCILKSMAWIRTDRHFYHQNPGGQDIILFVHCLSGSGIVYTDTEIYTMQKGHSLVLNIKNGYLARAMSDDFQFIWLQQTGFLPNQILGHLTKDRGSIFYTDTDILPLCDEIYTLAIQGWCYESEIRINCLLYDLWGALHVSRSPTYHTTAAHTYMDDHYMDENLSIQLLADLCHMGSYYFIRCFKKDYGLTPHQYLSSVRINQAKGLLLNTKLPVAVIASATGFRDASYFTRMFKKNIGCTPHEFRKNFISS